ncbi:MAG: SAM hydrolase/SAM-dependent halogenase family protein [Candidatus Odinarchaeia archaeon]
MKKIIGLLTDFGEEDEYVAAMKGVILSINPKAQIIDITHFIPSHDIVKGAFVLSSVVPYFPKDTVFVTVIDPGVGTGRRILLMETSKGKYLIGPDNGVLSLAAKSEGVIRVISVENSKYFLPEVSNTFHGRDIMAPVAAYVSKGVELNDFGPEVESFKTLEIPKPAIMKKYVEGEVLFKDHFGNLITNIDMQTLKKANLEFGKYYLLNVEETNVRLKLVKTYDESPIMKPLLTIGSKGLLEISVNQGDASKILGISPGAKIKLYL